MHKPTSEGRPGSLEDRVPAQGTPPLDALLAAVCDQFWRGLVIVNRDLQILFANRRARQMLEAADALQDISGLLRLRDPRRHSIFEGRLRQIAATPAGEAGSRFAFRLERAPAYAACSLLVSRLALPGDNAAPAVLVAIFDPRSSRIIDPAVLVALYGLTRAEAQVAVRLFAGLGVDEVALELGVSGNTVKTHLRHIFDKCEVASQSELLQLLALGPRR